MNVDAGERAWGNTKTYPLIAAAAALLIALVGRGGRRTAGDAHVFQRSESVWVPVGEPLTAGSDIARNANSGDAVAVSGDAVVAGAPGSEVYDNVEVGAVYFFERVGNRWKHVGGRYPASDVSPYSGFGAAYFLRYR